MNDQPSIWQQIGTALTTPGQEFQLPVKIPVEFNQQATRTIFTAAGIIAGSLIIAALLYKKK
jgi:hypothetical protein